MDPIGENLYQQARNVWRQEGFDAARRLIVERCQISHPSKHDTLLLYGNRDGAGIEMREEVVGQMYGYAPGVVLLDGAGFGSQEVSGVFDRCPPEAKQLFALRPFCADTVGVSLYIYPPTGGHFPNYPVWVSWDIGAGMAASYGSFGIYPERWERMKRWLDEFLPQE